MNLLTGKIIYLLAGATLLLSIAISSTNALAAGAIGKQATIDPRILGLLDSAFSQNSSLVSAVQQTEAAKVQSGLVDSTPLLFAQSSNGIGLNVITRGVVKDHSNFDVPGVTVHHISKTHPRVNVSANSPDAVLALAGLPQVIAIMPQYKPITQAGAVSSRAVQALRVDTAKLNFDATTPDTELDGTGQKVGILSDSFALTSGVRDGNTNPAAQIAGNLTGSRPQDSGDLPANIDLRNDSANGADEGAAMAELVYDIAPGADIAFYTAFISQGAFADGIDDLCGVGGDNANSSVVVDDVIYPNEPMYQDGVIAQAAAACVASGVPFFSASGNNANAGYRRTFVDINPAADDVVDPASGVDLHDWGGGDGYLAVTIPPNATVTIVLQWNQPFQSLDANSGSQVDLDLYLAPSPDAAGLSAAFTSKNTQGDTGAPLGDAIEIIAVSNPNLTPVTNYLAIEHYRGSQGMIPQDANTPLEFRVVTFQSGGRTTIEGINNETSAFGGPTMYGHSVAAGVTSVAAVPWFETAAYRPDLGRTTVTDPEPFSSRGGNITIQFAPNGTFAPRTSFEPDIAAVDGNNTTFFGGGAGTSVDGEPDGFLNFFGTSAAAPNAAAVAALLLEYRPNLTPEQVNLALANTSLDITGYRAAAGVDDVTGTGLIDTNAAINALANQPVADAGADFDADPGTEITVGGATSVGLEFLWEDITNGSAAPIVRGGTTQRATFFLPIAQPGDIRTFRVTARNPILNMSATDEVLVTMNNAAPKFAALSTQTVNAGALLQFTVSATDGNGTVPSLSAPSLPSGASFTDNGNGTGTFSWTPTAAGTHFATFRADDSNSSTDASVAISVLGVGGGGGGGGCSHASLQTFDPLLTLLLLLSTLYLIRKPHACQRGLDTTDNSCHALPATEPEREIRSKC